MKTLFLTSIANFYKQKMNYLESKLNKYNENEEVKTLIIKAFTPSKTSQNTLNFISNEEEENFFKNNSQSLNPQITCIIKLLYIILNEDFTSIKEKDLIGNLKSLMMTKYNKQNLKSLFFNVLIYQSNRLLSEKQINEIGNIMDIYPKLLHPNNDVFF